jgi:type I restriction enzyme S subunit
VSKELYDLPSGWTWTKVGEIAEVIRGASPRPKGDPRYFGGKIPWIMISDISREEGKYVSKTKDAVTEEGAKRSRYLKAGTLILSNSGTVCVPKILAVDGCIHDGFVAFPTIKEGIELLYLYHWFNYIRPIVIQENWRGITQVNLNTNIVKNLVVPLPPTNEQRRIVARVEALFAESKTVREALDKVPVLLRRFRQSVLAKAFRGELTQRDSNDEPAQNLLERIRQEKNKRKQTSLTDNQKEPSADLPKLPETWVWTNVGHISENYDGKRIPVKDKDREKMKGDLPYYGASGIIDYVNDYIFDGEYLLISEDGANLLSRSTPIAFIAKGKFWVNNHAHVLKTCGQIPLAYVEAYFNSISLAKWVTGTAQPKLTQGKMNTIPIPLAPLEEQKRIVAKIQELFSLADDIETAVKKAKQRADRIDQAILAKAFRGELVPQDPNDEPVSILLQRMKAAQK